ncbi:MAG: CBS domain-containing protein [Rikenellaceae bacterium]
MGITLIFILFSYALLKGSEFSYFSISSKDSEELKAKDDKRSKRVSKHILNPDYIAGTILLSETLLQISVLFLIIELFNRIFTPASYLFLVDFAILLIASFLLKYSGNFLLNSLSTDKRYIEFTLKMSAVFSFLLFLSKPFNMILSHFTDVLSETREERDAQSMEEYTEVVDSTDSEEAEEKRLLKKIVGLNNTSVFQIMKPRVEIVSLDMEMTSQEVVHKAIESGFSRLPVYENGPDNVKGFLYIKDLVGHLRGNITEYDWHKHIREAYFVPGSKKINDLLEEFRQKKMHFALVVDEYGGTDGIVTLEDILEEIVGEISDETDTIE